MADERESRPMPTELWSPLSRPRGAAGGPASRRSVRAGVAGPVAPPLLALVALALAAVVSYERAGDEIARARREMARRPAPATATAPADATGTSAATADAHLERALEQTRRARLVIAVGLVGALGMAVVAAVGLNRRLIRPIRTAERAARRVNAGEVGVRLDPSAAGEIGELAAAVNAIADDLDRSRPTLLAAAVVESSPDLVLIVGEEPTGDGEAHMCVRYASPAATVMLGRPSEWLTNVPVASFVHPDDRDKLAAIVRRSDGVALTQRASEIGFSHVQGRWIETEVAAADLGDDPNVGDVVLFVRDLFERKAQEEERATWPCTTR